MVSVATRLKLLLHVARPIGYASVSLLSGCVVHDLLTPAYVGPLLQIVPSNPGGFRPEGQVANAYRYLP